MQHIELDRLKIRVFTEQEVGADPLIVKSISPYEFKLQSYQETEDISKIKKCLISLKVAKNWKTYEINSLAPKIYKDGAMEYLTFSFKDEREREAFKRDMSLAIR